MWLSLWFCIRSHGTNFETTQCISNFVIRMSWHDPINMLHSSAISRTVKRRLENTISQTCATWAFSHEVEGHPKCGLIMCWLPTILKSHKPFITTCTVCALITINVFHHFVSLRKRFPRLKQNLMLMCYSWISAISNITRHPVHAHEHIALGWWLITAGW
jgi:hypothetical protein